MLETVDGSGSGGVFVDENQASCGSILATGNLHLSPIGAVLQQARKPKPAAGERSAIAGGTFPKNLGCTPYAVRHRWLMTLVVQSIVTV